MIVTDSRTGTPGPLVKFPGAYDAWDHGMHFVILSTENWFANLRVTCRHLGSV